MTHLDASVQDAILRKNFEIFLRRMRYDLNPGSPYLPNWHIQAIAYQLERIRRGEITRFIINMPPRYLKSLTVSVAFTAFMIGTSTLASDLRNQLRRRSLLEACQ